jgi:MFS transporter, DHA2 family, metal-tetracycline-proton antiporter
MSAGDERAVSTRLFLAVAASAVFVSVLTATMINVLIPLIRAQFGASAAEVGWVVTGVCCRTVAPKRSGAST